MSNRMGAEYKAPENHTDPETSNKDSDLLSVTASGGGWVTFCDGCEWEKKLAS
jgi:hypothetical protein